MLSWNKASWRVSRPALVEAPWLEPSRGGRRSARQGGCRWTAIRFEMDYCIKGRYDGFTGGGIIKRGIIPYLEKCR